MSDTFRVGDNVVLRDVNDILLPDYGVLTVCSSDISNIVAEWFDGLYYTHRLIFNAGTLRCTTTMLSIPLCRIAHPTQEELELIQLVQSAKRVADDIASRASRGAVTESGLRAALAALSDGGNTCATCTYWRPPFASDSRGNCHSCQTRNMLETEYPPTTYPTFGCRHWEAKSETEETLTNE